MAVCRKSDANAIRWFSFLRPIFRRCKKQNLRISMLCGTARCSEILGLVLQEIIISVSNPWNRNGPKGFFFWKQATTGYTRGIKKAKPMSGKR